MNEQGEKTPTVEVVDLTSDDDLQVVSDDDSNPAGFTSLRPAVDEGAPFLASEDEDGTEQDQWESGSLYEDALEELEDDRLIDMGEHFTQSLRAFCSLRRDVFQMGNPVPLRKP